MRVTDKKILTPAIAISVTVLSGTVYYGVQLNQKNKNNTTYAEVQNSVNTMTPENAPDDYVVKIPSNYLRNRIKEVLGNANMPDSELTFGKLKTITILHANPLDLISVNGDVFYASQLGIGDSTSLDGLQFLINLESLGLTSGTYKDISPLENLTKLKFLNISRNKNLTDISKLAKLTNLENLQIFRNSIKDISVVRNMPRLKYFIADYNDNIDDISALGNKPDLKVVLLEGNKIKDFSPLKNAPLTNLHDYFNFQYAKNAFNNQRPEITVHSKVFENPLKAIDGTTIPISENAVVKNVDKAGNPDQNGGYIKLETTEATLQTTVGFNQRVTGIINAANDNQEIYNFQLKISYIGDDTAPIFNTQTPSKITVRKSTDISAKIAEVTATDAESGLKSLTNNTADINLNITNPAKGSYTLRYTATNNNNISATLDREIEIVDADALNNEINKRSNKDLALYTAESIAKYKEIIKEVKDIFNNPDSTQDQVNQATEKIKNSESVLRPDKSDLKDAIGAVDTLEDWLKNIPEVVKAKEEAQKVFNNPDATLEEVQKAEAKLAEEIEKAEKNEETRQQSAENATENAMKLKTPESIKNAQTLLDEVKDGKVKEIFQKELDKIKKDLNDKKDELQKLIEKAKSINLDGKTKDSLDKLKDEILKSEKVLNGANSSQSALEKAVDDLNKALKGVKTDKKPVADAITKHDTKPDWIKKDKDVVKLFEKANEVIAKKDPSVEEVRKSAKDLLDAIEKLEKTNKEAVDESENLLKEAEKEIKANNSKPDELPVIDIDEIEKSIENVLDPVKKEELKEKLEQLKINIQKKKESIDKRKLEEAERIAQEKLEKARMLKHPDTGALRIKQQNQNNNVIGMIILGLFSILGTITAVVVRKK
nr:MAG TPA: MAEBL protein [Caudoviricetes sp.]